ncbi:MAG: DPP IV N-terminal domain-containing protein, partial [Pseudomonadota bacterium]
MNRWTLRTFSIAIALASVFVITGACQYNSTTFSESAATNLNEERLARAEARANGSYVDFTGSVLVDFAWLDDGKLGYQLASPEGQVQSFILNPKDAQSATATEYAAPDSSSSWPDGVDMAGVPGPEFPSSPDGRYSIKRQGPDLALVDNETDEIRRLTYDGDEDYVYAEGILFGWSGQIALQQAGFEAPPSVLWSPDGRFILTFIADVRGVGRKVYTTSGLNGDGEPNFAVYEVTHPSAGDANIPTARFVLIDTNDGQVREIQLEHVYQKASDPLRAAKVAWSKDSSRIYFYYGDLAERNAYLQSYSTDTASSRTIWQTSGVFQGHWRDWWPLSILSTGNIVVPSDESGYRHLYSVYVDEQHSAQRISRGN